MGDGMKDGGLRVSERQMRALRALARDYDSEANCLYFSTIAKRSRLNIRQARLATRALARKGLAEFIRVLFNGDLIAGSGYCCTPAGHAMLAAREKEPQT